MAYSEHLTSGKYFNKSCKSLSVLVRFFLYIQRIIGQGGTSAVLKLANFTISLFFTSLTSTHTILLILIHLASKNITKNHVNRHPSQLIYDTNLSDNSF